MTKIEIKDSLAKMVAGWRKDNLDDFLAAKSRIADGLSELAIINAYGDKDSVKMAMVGLSEYNKLIDDLLSENDN